MQQQGNDKLLFLQKHYFKNLEFLFRNNKSPQVLLNTMKEKNINICSNAECYFKIKNNFCDIDKQQFDKMQ